MPSDPLKNLQRREFLRLSAASAGMLLPSWNAVFGEAPPASPGRVDPDSPTLYAGLLHTWCDGLLAHQVALPDPALKGGVLCPACGLIHGRCGEAVYPLLRVAQSTGDDRYVRAALLVHAWSEEQVSRRDGSWSNDVTLSSWQGITVFHSIALAEALHHHGSLLDAATRQSWRDRLAAAAKFLDGFITIETGNINYPVTSSLAFTLSGQVLGDGHYLDRGRQMAHAVLDYFTADGILYGEGHPQRGVTAKGCRPVDLGYNVEESLPSLGLYAVVARDRPVLEQVVAAMRTHMEFLLPDGAWDNSWGTRNYKWSWWGSRTTDGCHPGFVLLADHDARFREVAWRNLELMAACTQDGLLYGGPDYAVHGDRPCIHHSFTHAKALATVLDRAGDAALRPERRALPRDEPYGLKSYAVVATHLAAVGAWRATVTAYDCPYEESGASAHGGGHVSGGSLSLLYHMQLGPVLTASMTRYTMIEIANQQAFRDAPHMPLTPRIELNRNGTLYASTNDNGAVLTAQEADGAVRFEAQGQLLTVGREPLPEGEVQYRLRYRLTAASVEIAASFETGAQDVGPVRLILPVIARADEPARSTEPGRVEIAKARGKLTVQTNGAAFEAIPAERTFNLVPGFECVPLLVTLKPGVEVVVRLEVGGSGSRS